MKPRRRKLRMQGTLLEERGIRTMGTTLEEWRNNRGKQKARPSGRDADPRRTIPLNSSAWRKLRERVLARDPICQECYKRGHITVATDVDHVSGDPSNNSMANLQGLCGSCHSRKTRREMNGSPQSWGCDADGHPTDPDHPWNQKSREAERERPPPQCSFNPKSENEP